MQLYNKLSAKERSALIDQAGKDRLTISFYQYAKIGNPQVFRDTLFIKWDSLGVLGRIYVANEGIKFLKEDCDSVIVIMNEKLSEIK